MFFEGKNIIESAKSEIRYACGALLLFALAVFLFIVISGFNLYYVGFLFVFLVFFLAIYIFLVREKKKGEKQCIYAVQNSKSTDIVNKQIDNRKAGRLIVDSMSSTIDKYDTKEKFPTFIQKLKRKRKHNQIVEVINKFENENKKSQ